ncbi:ATP-binding protein [Terrimonas sp. NA20]|uniref:histidine kinase n=1 Tax=Terrimonas ginsenosidimutans TaxID=2908004 RepID=A0ABS9KPV6_9BACT|nr:ATP-binding protein [Terrimonas ginsenosidimutans]MCG2614341.1 ATP-binding protein [Terrimonas ginsenosidimutans]
MQKEALDLIVSIISASVFVLLLMIAVFSLFRIYLKRKNTLLQEKQRMAVQFEQTLLQSKLEIQEQTFADISREIHDNIGQVLSLARINLNTLNVPADNNKINLVDELMEKAITDLRNLSHSLDSDMIRNKGWLEPTQRLLRDLEKTGKYTARLIISENPPTLGHDRPIILFRMIQEVINNIIKHAGANSIDLHVSKDKEHLTIIIKDNGKGFSKEKSSAGAGLRNLENRARMIAADLHIDSEIGAGTTITISVKLEPNE